MQKHFEILFGQVRGQRATASARTYHDVVVYGSSIFDRLKGFQKFDQSALIAVGKPRLFLNLSVPK